MKEDLDTFALVQRRSMVYNSNDFKSPKDTHKQDMKTQTNLMNSIDRLTNQVADLTTQNKTLQQKVNDLLSQISVGNKVRLFDNITLTIEETV